MHNSESRSVSCSHLTESDWGVSSDLTRYTLPAVPVRYGFRSTGCLASIIRESLEPASLRVKGIEIAKSLCTGETLSACPWERSATLTPIRLRPVDPPTFTRHRHPEQSLWRCSPNMVVQRSGSLVEPSCMPRVRESEPLKIEMVAELVAEGAEEGSERGDVFPHRRARPYTDQHALGSIVSKKL